MIVRDMDAGLVKPKENLVNSEYMATVLVMIPRNDVAVFTASYETLSQLVVPRSAKRVAEDADTVLFRVIVMKKYAEDFRTALRNKKWVIREYQVCCASDSCVARAPIALTCACCLVCVGRSRSRRSRQSARPRRRRAKRRMKRRICCVVRSACRSS